MEECENGVRLCVRVSGGESKRKGFMIWIVWQGVNRR